MEWLFSSTFALGLIENLFGEAQANQVDRSTGQKSQ
jgi:hypothetical protein